MGEQRVLFEGHGTILQASLDDPGDERVFEEVEGVYREVDLVEVGAWIDKEELRGKEGNIKVKLTNGRTLTVGQGELTELVKLAGLQPHRVQGDKVWVPATWLVGERVGY